MTKLKLNRRDFMRNATLVSGAMILPVAMSERGYNALRIDSSRLQGELKRGNINFNTYEKTNLNQFNTCITLPFGLHTQSTLGV